VFPQQQSPWIHSSVDTNCILILEEGCNAPCSPMPLHHYSHISKNLSSFGGDGSVMLFLSSLISFTKYMITLNILGSDALNLAIQQPRVLSVNCSRLFSNLHHSSSLWQTLLFSSLVSFSLLPINIDPNPSPVSGTHPEWPK
jgi:hypothetical protein